MRDPRHDREFFKLILSGLTCYANLELVNMSKIKLTLKDPRPAI